MRGPKWVPPGIPSQALRLRIWDLAPKGPDKSAQGIALGTEADAVEDGEIPTNRKPCKGGTIEGPRDVTIIGEKPDSFGV